MTNRSRLSAIACWLCLPMMLGCPIGDLNGDCRVSTTDELAAMAARDPKCGTIVLENSTLVSLVGIEPFGYGTIRLLNNDNLVDISQIDGFAGTVDIRGNPTLARAELGPLAGFSAIAVSDNFGLRELFVEAGGSEPWEAEEPSLELVLGVNQEALADVAVSCAADLECPVDVEAPGSWVDGAPALRIEGSKLRRLRLVAPDEESFDAVLSWPVPSIIEIVEMPAGTAARSAAQEFVDA